MSRRNTNPNEKAARKISKALRNTPPSYIDLVAYVKDRTKCSTTTAKKVLLSGALRVDSHPVGFKWANDPLTGNAVKILNPYLDAKHRDSIVIQWDAEEAAK